MAIMETTLKSVDPNYPGLRITFSFLLSVCSAVFLSSFTLQPFFYLLVNTLVSECIHTTWFIPKTGPKAASLLGVNLFYTFDPMVKQTVSHQRKLLVEESHTSSVWPLRSPQVPVYSILYSSRQVSCAAVTLHDCTMKQLITLSLTIPFSLFCTFHALAPTLP